MGNFLVFLIQLYSFVLLGRVLLTWLPNVDYRNPIVRGIIDLTEPVLRPIRQALPPTGGVDFSPLVVFLILSVITRFLA